MWDSAEKDVMSYRGSLQKGYSINVGFTMQGASERELSGGILHELSHIDEDRHENGNKYSIKLYKKSRKFRHLNERYADLMVVARGGGNILIEFKKYLERKGCHDHYGNGGISIEELRRIESIKNLGQ